MRPETSSLLGTPKARPEPKVSSGLHADGFIIPGMTQQNFPATAPAPNGSCSDKSGGAGAEQPLCVGTWAIVLCGLSCQKLALGPLISAASLCLTASAKPLSCVRLAS